jgi:hypothetical protein
MNGQARRGQPSTAWYAGTSVGLKSRCDRRPCTNSGAWCRPRSVSSTASRGGCIGRARKARSLDPHALTARDCGQWVARKRRRSGWVERCDRSVPRTCRSVEQADAFEERGAASLERNVAFERRDEAMLEREVALEDRDVASLEPMRRVRRQRRRIGEATRRIRRARRRIGRANRRVRRAIRRLRGATRRIGRPNATHGLSRRQVNLEEATCRSTNATDSKSDATDSKTDATHKMKPPPARSPEPTAASANAHLMMRLTTWLQSVSPAFVTMR